MRTVRGLFCTLAVLIFAISAIVAEAQSSSLNIQLTGANAQLNVIFQTGPKGTQKAPPVTPDPSTGAVVLPPGLLSPDKPHTRMTVYQCPDGNVYVVAEGTADPCPGRSRKLGGFWWDTGGKVTIDLTTGTVTDTSTTTSGPSTSVGGGTSSSGFTNIPTVGFDLAGFGGANVFSGGYSSPARPKGGADFDVMFHPWHNYFGLGPYVGFVITPSGTVERFGDSSTSGSNIKPQGTTGSTFGSYSARRFDVPVGLRLEQNFGRFGISEEAGALPSFAKLVARFCSTGSSGSSCDSSTIVDQTIVGYTYGLRVHYALTKHLSVLAGWTRDGALRSSGNETAPGVSFDSNEAYGGVGYSWGW